MAEVSPYDRLACRLTHLDEYDHIAILVVIHQRAERECLEERLKAGAGPAEDCVYRMLCAPLLSAQCCSTGMRHTAVEVDEPV